MGKGQEPQMKQVLRMATGIVFPIEGTSIQEAWAQHISSLVNHRNSYIRAQASFIDETPTSYLINLYKSDPSLSVRKMAFSSLCFRYAQDAKIDYDIQRVINETHGELFPEGVISLAFSDKCKLCKTVWKRVQTTRDIYFLMEAYDLAWVRSVNEGRRIFLLDIIAERCADLVTQHGDQCTYPEILYNRNFYEHSPEASRYVIDHTMRRLCRDDYCPPELINVLVFFLQSKSPVKDYAIAKVIRAYLINKSVPRCRIISLIECIRIPEDCDGVSSMFEEWGCYSQAVWELSQKHGTQTPIDHRITECLLKEGV